MNIDLRLTGFLPALLIPFDAYRSCFAGLFLLFISLYSLTIDNGFSPFFRVAIAPFAVYFFYDFGYGSYETVSSQVSVGMVTVGLYGIMRVVETTVGGFLDREPPLWVKEGKKAPLPSTILHRLFYALDLLTSLRGTSWKADRVWDWAPRSLVFHESSKLSRQEFVKRAVRKLVFEYLLVDFLDTCNKSRSWNMSKLDPITSLTFAEQIFFSLSVCTGIMLAIEFNYTAISMIMVLLGSSPACWPPMFINPFSAPSIRAFWTKHWHAIFRRTFGRLASHVLFFAPLSNQLLQVCRALLIFLFSASLHILIMYRLDIDIRGAQQMHPKKTFLDPAIIKFFLSQPIGLAIEVMLVEPMARMTTVRWRNVLRRVWVWSFLLWVGRYWSDCWVHRGMWQPSERVVGYSVIRGFWKGEWAT